MPDAGTHPSPAPSETSTRIANWLKTHTFHHAQFADLR